MKRLREKVLGLNKIDKFHHILYGVDYIMISRSDEVTFHHGNENSKGGCIFCLSDINSTERKHQIKLTTENNNNINYWVCNNCEGNKLCAYCLREKENCNITTKQKIAFWLCTKTIFPKDIRRLITNYF